jgi:hypothetical protein
MMKSKDKKKDTLASRARAKAMDTMMMKAPARKAPAAMATPSGLASMQPPESAPMGMKKGGAVKMKGGGKVPPKKGGLMIMIAMGKKKGK